MYLYIFQSLALALACAWRYLLLLMPFPFPFPFSFPFYMCQNGFEGKKINAPFQLIMVGNLFSSFENWIVTRVIRTVIVRRWLTVLFVIWQRQRGESAAWLAKGYHFYQINAIATRLQKQKDSTRRRERMGEEKNQIPYNCV